MANKILIVVTSHAEFPGERRDTGYWVGEVSHFYEAVHAVGFEVDVVSPEGGKAPMDPRSASGLQAMDGGFKAYLRSPELQQKLADTRRPDQVSADDYVAIYFAGGHGTLWDFPQNQALAQLAARLYEQGKVVSAVCHGVVGLLNVRLSSGNLLIKGRAVTGFADLEEKLLGLATKVPFLTESALREHGARYERGFPFLPHVAVSERLITGQNPASTRAVAARLISALKRTQPAQHAAVPAQGV